MFFLRRAVVDFLRRDAYNVGMEKSIRLRAFAKANLSLNITGKRDGLHTLDSVMVSLDAFDTVTVTERADDNICVRFFGAEVDPIKNTAYKAAAAVKAVTDIPGLDINIEKGIPIGAGLGGSSADGAAVLRALDLFYGLPSRGVDMRSLALSVGSDVPFMLTGGMARVTGVGEEMFFIENKLSLFAVGLMSGAVSTAAAYAEFDKLFPSGVFAPTDNEALCQKLLDADSSAIELAANALYEPAAKLCPSIKAQKERLTENGAVACMTGSGGMTLGWFTDIDKFALAASALKSESGFRVFSTPKTGVLHEWISR